MKTIAAIDPGVSGGIVLARFGKAECFDLPAIEGRPAWSLVGWSMGEAYVGRGIERSPRLYSRSKAR